VVAEEQVKGRGRSGDVWHSPPGAGLWLSTLVAAAPDRASCLPLLVGLAAARAAEAVAELTVGIKWPNDLFLGDRKVGGILCEGGGDGVVVGVGINVRTPLGGFPEPLRQLATSVEATAGAPVSRSALAGRLLRELRGLAVERPTGLEDLTEEEVEELVRRDVLAGRRVRTGSGEGRARGVDARGALLVERPDGTVERVVAGSVRPA
jgi:BirA family biotin operon repressor/biotin-[acetyl-CoA-carboxylase] ligase